jgi:hypothetical protein
MQHPSNFAHLMRRFVRGSSIHVYQFFIPNDLQAQFSTCATRGADSVGTSTYPSIPKYKHKRQRHASQTAKLDIAPQQNQSPSPIHNVQCLFKLRLVGFTRLPSQYITRACGVNFHAPFTHPQTKPRALNTASTPPKLLQQIPKNTVMWNTK